MKRNLVARITVLVFFLNLLLPASLVQAYTVQRDDHFKEQIAEGVFLETIRQMTSEGPLNISVVTVDLHNPYVKVDTLAGDGITANKSISQHAADGGAIAAVNGDFFQMNSHRAPIGLTVKSGQLMTSPAQRTDMYGFGITRDKVPVFNIWGFQGQVTAPNQKTYPLFGVNKPTYLADKGASSDLNRLNLYNSQWGMMSRGSWAGITGYVEMVVQDNIVKEIRVDKPSVYIPVNGYILAGHGEAAKFLQENFQVGSQVLADYKYTPNLDLQAAVGGQTLLVNYGKRCYFTQNIKGNRARTAVGISQDSATLYLVAVEGGKTSRGMSQEEFADFLVSIGVWQALNLDGGGSTTMVARYLGDEKNSLINVPQEGVERKVPNGIGIFTTAPRGPLAGLKISGSDLMVVNMARPFYAKGFDEHFNPSQVNPGDLTWSIEPAIGTFNGNILTATGGGDAVVTASNGNVSKSIPVHIIGANEISRLEILPSSINVNEGDVLNLGVKLYTKDNRCINLAPGEVEWEVTGQVGSIQGNTFTAANSRGLGEVVAKVDGVEARAQVAIGSNEVPFYSFENGLALGFDSYPAGVTGGFRYTTGDEPVYRGAAGVKLAYNFTGSKATRAAYGHLGSEGLVLPGKPLGLSMWVWGNGGNGHWLRGKIEDANEAEKTIDFATKVDWQGWRKVTAKLPAGLTYPVKLTELYLAAPEGSGQDVGSIFMDELSLMVPVTADNIQVTDPVAESAIKPVPAGGNESLSLGSFQLKLPAGALAEQADLKLEQVWKLNMATPGYFPALPAVNVNIEGDKGQVKLAKPIDVSVDLGTVAPAKARLLWWDSANSSWRLIPSKIDGHKLVGKTEAAGLFALMTDGHAQPNFPDLQGNWAKDEIISMAARDIVKGMAANSFAPSKQVTRGEFVTILARAFGWTAGDTKVSFKDAIPSWAQSSVGAAVSKGIVKGYEDGTFKPQRVITRAEMAVIMDRILALPGTGQNLPFQDANKVAPWAKPAVAKASASGLLKGNQGFFRPLDTATRAEATVVVSRMIGYYLED